MTETIEAITIGVTIAVIFIITIEILALAIPRFSEWVFRTFQSQIAKILGLTEVIEIATKCSICGDDLIENGYYVKGRFHICKECWHNSPRHVI